MGKGEGGQAAIERARGSTWNEVGFLGVREGRAVIGNIEGRAWNEVALPGSRYCERSGIEAGSHEGDWDNEFWKRICSVSWDEGSTILIGF